MLEKIISFFCFIQLANFQVFAQTPTAITTDPSPTISPLPSPTAIFSPTLEPSPTRTPSLEPNLTPTPQPTPTSTENSPLIIIYSVSACPSENGEFVQLQNLDQQTVSLSNWQIGDLTSSRDKIETLTLINSEIAKVSLKNVKLNNNGDEIFLYDQNSQIIDHVVYTTCTQNQLILFHQPTPTPTESASPTPTLTLMPTASNISITITSTPSAKITPSTIQIEKIKLKNYPTPQIFKLNKMPESPILTQNFLVENILYQEARISPLLIANVIMTGMVLIWIGLFLNYEANQ